MQIVNHFAAGVEIIKVNEENKKVMVENQSYSPTCHTTKSYINSYDFGQVPPHIWGKIKKEKLRIEEEN
tara:strand:+ start:114 stop:320 length:207 start_codon:yes stop_codon:yes gene_type:complete